MEKTDTTNPWLDIINNLKDFSASDVVIKYRPIPIDVLKSNNLFAITEDSIRMNIDNFELKGISKEGLSIMEEVITDGKFIKQAGLTPLYLYNEDSNDILITSKEYYEGKFN